MGRPALPGRLSFGKDRRIEHVPDAPEPSETADDRPRLTRRGFLAGTLAAALAACSDGDSDPTSSPSTTGPSTVPGTTTPSATDPPAPTTTVADTTSTSAAPATTAAAPELEYPFTIGVASGDPLPDSVILWTRLVTADPLPEGDIAVDWEVATDAEMGEIVVGGTGTAIAALGHSVHVDASGLAPDTEYYFRFRAGGHESGIARTRTFAAPGTTPERFRFAFSSCQNWEQGYYAAYRDVVEQGEVDAFVFLGDYIYEYASGGYSDPRSRVTGQDFECETVEQYRARYALYRTDPLLQAAHARMPWIITWDDHEVDNDYAADIGSNDPPTDEFLTRRAAAYQVWYEHMPVRLAPPAGPDYDIYRSFAHGDLLRFHVLDTRQYRSDQQRSDPFFEPIGDAVQELDATVSAAPGHTMLGEQQTAWLFDGVEESSAIWDVLAQQVFMFGGNAVQGAEPPVVVVDTWDGYPAERERVLSTVGDAVDNLVVLTGDFHSAAVGDLRTDPFNTSLPIAGTELMASSISSAFFDTDESIASIVESAIVANPQIKWFDSRRGYTICDVTPDRWQATYRAVDDPFDEASTVSTVSEWQITAGTPGAQPFVGR